MADCCDMLPYLGGGQHALQVLAVEVQQQDNHQPVVLPQAAAAAQGLPALVALLVLPLLLLQQQAVLVLRLRWVAVAPPLLLLLFLLQQRFAVCLAAAFDQLLVFPLWWTILPTWPAPPTAPVCPEDSALHAQLP
jgi:hypothetical protein